MKGRNPLFLQIKLFFFASNTFASPKIVPGGNEVEVPAHHAEERDEGRGIEEHAAAVLQDGAKEACGVKSQGVYERKVP